MEMRRFGASELAVSKIGLGTWPMSGLKYGSIDDAAAVEAVRVALDAGITCFDTAPSYGAGHAEELLGRGLEGRRHEAVVVTKGGLVWLPDASVTGRNSRREYLEPKLDESLRRLRTDYVDLFLIHWPDRDLPVAEAMEALEELVQTGKVRQIGVSNFSAERVKESVAALKTAPLVANQVAFSLFDRRWEQDGFATCAELGVGIMAYGPLAHGLLAGAFNRETTFEADDWRAAGVFFGQPLLTPENFGRNLDVVDRLKGIAGDLGVTMPQLAIAWVLREPAVTVALVGPRTREEIETALPAADLELDAATLAAIDEVMRDAAGMTDVLPN